jgi:hypothetical protein
MNRPPSIPAVGCRYDKPSLPAVERQHTGSGLPPIQNHSDSRHDGRAVLRTAARKAARGQAPKPPNAPASNARAGWLLLPPLLPIAPVGWWLVSRALQPVHGFGLVGMLLLGAALGLAGALGLAMATRWRPPGSKQHEEPARTGKA